MEINELMIGDWVLVNGIPMQIQAINDIDGEIMAGDELYCLIEDRVHSEDKIEPIPLTIEILEKNGYILSKPQWMTEAMEEVYVYKDIREDIRVEMELKSDDNFNEFFIMRASRGANNLELYISKVHKLQHILKDCYIDKEIVL